MNMPEETTQSEQAWTARRFAYFHGQYDTKIETGEEYPTQALSKIFTMRPGDKAKGVGLAMIPSTYHEYDAREHAAQREHGAFIALTGDIDGGNLPLETVREAVGALAEGAAWVVYASPHARPDDMRWRIIIPLADAQSFEAWHDAQLAFYAFMEARGITMDYALARAAQPVYLPNVPPIHAKTETPLRGEDGKPLYYVRKHSGLDKPGLDLTSGIIAQGITALRHQRLADEKARDAIRREAEARRASMPRGDGASLIEDFTASNTVAAMLEMCGYEQSPRNADDWRSPHQTGETYATRVIGSKWVSLSASDTAAGLGSKCDAGCYGDAYDLFVHYKHGGDHKAAFRALHAERRANNPNVIYPKQFEPVPDWLAEIPSYDEVPEWLDGPEGPDAEIILEEFEAASAPKSALPFEWAGKTSPVLDGLWLIDDWLPKTGIAAVYGHPGSGKSFFVLDMAAHVAAGREWAGKHVERGLVVYVVAEGQTGFRNRIFAMQQAGRIEHDSPFVFIPTPIDMQAADGDLKVLMETIHQASEQAQMPVAMLVIDTLSKTFGAGKENTDDMASYVANCQRVSSHFDCLTIVVHHRPKDSESRDLRGHSSLRGGIETTILVEAGDIKTATTLKQKDGEDNMVVRFKLERVVIGEDKRGKEISTCLTEIVEGEAPAMQKDPRDARKARLSGHKKTALRAIEEAIAAAGVEPPADIPGEMIDRYRTWKAANAETISERLKNEFYALEDGDEAKRRDNARRNANRALKDLKSSFVIGTWGEWIWVN